MAQYKRDGLSRLADAAGLSTQTGDAVQQYAMGATDPMQRGIEAFARIPRGLKSLGDVMDGSAVNPKIRFWTKKELAERFGDLTPTNEFGRYPEDLQTARVMIDSDLSRFGLRDAPMHAQPKVIQDMAGEYGVGPTEKFRTLDRVVRRDISDNASEMLPKQDRDMLAQNRYTQKGVHGLVQAYTDAGQPEAAFNVFDPRRVKILERLAAMGLTGEALVQAVQQMSAPPQKKQPTGGW